MRYSLRTLLVVLLLGDPLCAFAVEPVADSHSNRPFVERMERLIDLLQDDKEDRSEVIALANSLKTEHQWKCAAIPRTFAADDEWGVVTITSQGERLFVLACHDPSPLIPAADRWTALLIDRSGKQLSSLTCEVSSRLTMVAPHELERRTNPTTPERDSVVIGLGVAQRDAENISNFESIVTVDGVCVKSPLRFALSAASQADRQIEHILCRATVTNRKWRLIWPAVKPSEPK
jgi:hypothetical protein